MNLPQGTLGRDPKPTSFKNMTARGHCHGVDPCFSIGELTTGLLLLAMLVMRLLKKGVLNAYSSTGLSVGASAETILWAKGSFATTSCSAPAIAADLITFAYFDRQTSQHRVEKVAPVLTSPSWNDISCSKFLAGATACPAARTSAHSESDQSSQNIPRHACADTA